MMYCITNGQFDGLKWRTVWFTNETIARGLYTLAMMAHVRDGIRPKPEFICVEEPVEKLEKPEAEDWEEEEEDWDNEDDEYGEEIVYD